MFLERLKETIKDVELKNLESERGSMEEKISELEEQLNALKYSSFNFLQRKITKRSQYRNESASALKLQMEICDLRASIIAIDRKIKIFYNIRQPIIEGARTLQGLGMTFEEALKLMKENNCELKFDSYGEALEVAKETFSPNARFMKEAIKEEPYLIMYDRSNDKELYIEFIDSVIAEVEENENIDSWRKMLYIEAAKSLKEEIKNPGKVLEGRYKVQQEDIFAGIRGYVAEGLESSTQEPYWKAQALYATKFSLDMSESLSIEDGKKLEGIYDDKSSFFVHGGGHDFRDSLFSKGLRATSQAREKRALFRTAKPITSFLGLLGYHYQNSGEILNGNFILKIPQNAEYIWGSNSPNGEIENCYILPEFVIGELDFSPSKSKGELVRFKENTLEKEKYTYFFRDGSRLGDKPKTMKKEEVEM